MSSLTRIEAARWLLENDRFVIVSHRRPDGDTIGSSAALCLGLRQLGKAAHVLKNTEITEKYLHLHASLNKNCPEPGDILICVDVASPGLLPANSARLQNEIALRIDHHGSGTAFTPFELVDDKAGACGDIIYDLLQEMGVKLDKVLAEALYTAVATDTGGFRYANTNAHSYQVAAACAEAGGDLYAINQTVFDTNSLAKLRLQGWIVENLRLSAGGKVAVCALPLAVEKQLGVTEDDMENISGFSRSIEGVELAATLRETGDGNVKISVRAVPGYDASRICELFGGGGHKGAAGATTALSLEETAAAVQQAMETMERENHERNRNCG